MAGQRPAARRQSNRPPVDFPGTGDLETGDAIVDIDRLRELVGESSAMAGVRETLRRLLVAQARARSGLATGA